MSNEGKSDDNLTELSNLEKIAKYSEMLDEDYLRALEHIRKEYYNNEGSYRENVLRSAKIDFYDEIVQYMSKLPSSNGSRLFKKLSFNVGIICDEFLYHSLKDSANVKYISADGNGMNESLDFLIVATTWEGIDESWRGVSNPEGIKRAKLYEIIQNARKNDIPVVFYSKEDPVNFDQFKDIALRCDYIFTTAQEVVDDYKSISGHDKVDVLEFGINPIYHNPIGSRTDTSKLNENHVIFAGSWTEKYPIRNQESTVIFDGVRSAGSELTIFDRNLNLDKSRYHFPRKYITHLTFPITHDDLMKVHRLYRWAININSVKYSETMFANRVYELQAIGNLVFSNYSVGINNKFTNVFLIHQKEDVENIIYYQSESDLEDIRAKGIRQTMLNHTGVHRIDQIAKTIGLNSNLEQPKILVIVDGKTPDILECFNNQRYVHKKLVTNEEVTQEVVENHNFVTYFSRKYYYEEYHLEDLLSGFVYTDVDYITKSDSHAHRYINDINNVFLTMFDKRAITSELSPSTTGRGYCIPETEIFSNKIKSSSKKLLSVVIPVHNNGNHLEDKCFRSLARSSIFEKMEIILVNDGSTERETIQTIKRLLRRHPDIKYIELMKASGSASVPRNVGVKQATTPYITFLDPDNEALGDGYATLFKKMMDDQSIDMTVGNVIKEDHEQKKLFNYYGTVLKYNDNHPVITDTFSYMKRSGLRAQSIQAMIFKREIVEKNNLKMIEGAAGQDTLFFLELMLKCKKVLAVDTNVHVYYAAITGSVTNTLGAKFFDKYLKLEKERIPFLEKNGLMKTYLEKRFNYYIKNWYLLRIDRTKLEEREKAIEKFLELYSLYDKYDNNKVYDESLESAINDLKKELNSSSERQQNGYKKNKI